MMMSPSAASGKHEAAVDAIIAHLVSLKDVVAAGFRCPALLANTLLRAPKEHRECVTEVDQRLRQLFADFEVEQSANAAESSDVATPLRRISSSGTSGAHSSPCPVPSPSYTAASSAASFRSRDGSMECSSSLLSRFRSAFLGSSDAPQPVGQERHPRPFKAGLVHGDDAPLREVLVQHATRHFCESFLEIVESPEIHDCLAFVNMMWLQQYPVDWEAAAADSKRLAAFTATKRDNTAGLGEGSSDFLSGSSSKGEVRSLSPLENSMRFLLFLNLNLKFPPSSWVPLLQIRDDAMACARSHRRNLDAAIRDINIAANCFPSVIRVFNALDLVLSATALLNIYATPADIQQVLFEKFSNALMDLQVVMHDHVDVSRNKRLKTILESTATAVIASMKLHVSEISRMELNAS